MADLVALNKILWRWHLILSIMVWVSCRYILSLLKMRFLVILDSKISSLLDSLISSSIKSSLFTFHSISRGVGSCSSELSELGILIDSI